MNTLKVVGSGMLGAAQLTAEGRSAIESAQRVFWVGSVPGLVALLAQGGIVGEDLSRLYRNGAADTDNYARIKAHVLEALDAGQDCALVVPGHPRVGVTIVQELQAMAERGELRMVCFPGISSFDAMLNDMGLDPLEEGACVVDANRLILYDYAMEPALNYFIYHVCSVGNRRTDYLDPAHSSHAGFLGDKLRRHYPGDQVLYLLSASIEPGTPPQRIAGTVSGLDKLLQSVTFAHTLFVPGVLPKREQVNWGFLERMREGAAA